MKSKHDKTKKGWKLKSFVQFELSSITVKYLLIKSGHMLTDVIRSSAMAQSK